MAGYFHGNGDTPGATTYSDGLSIVTFNTKFLLPHKIEMKINLQRHDHTFYMIDGTADGYRIVIEDITLRVPYTIVMDEIFMKIERGITTHGAKMPVSRIGIIEDTIAKGTTIATIQGLIKGNMPDQVYIAMVENGLTKGDKAKNPFNFQHFNPKEYEIRAAGCTLPNNHMPLNLTTGNNKHGDKQDQQKPKSRSLLKRRVVDDSGGATKKIKLRPPSPMVIIDDPEIKVFVQKNIEAIQKRKRVHRACQSFNFPLKSNNITPGLLLTHLNEIYDQASGKLKVQMGIGRILRNKENGELKYWRAEHCDSHLLQNQKVVQPMKVNSRSDLKQIAENASNLATEDYLQSTRPDTKWELVMPTNVRYYISYTDFVAGYITENLPDYLLKKESVNCLHRDYNAASYTNNFYQDKLCFFRCLAYHKLKHDKNHKLMCIGRPLNLLTHQLYYDYNKDVNQHRNQEQVGLDQLLELEAYF